jgi:nitronate monooxygenase
MHTPLTDLLAIEQPLVLAPMGTWANVSLAAAVSNGGGLGTFGAVGRLMGLTPQVVRDNLAALSDLTDRPIGAGFITQLIPESPENLDIVLEAGVPVVLFSFADPTPYVGLARDAGPRSSVRCTHLRPHNGRSTRERTSSRCRATRLGAMVAGATFYRS